MDDSILQFGKPLEDYTDRPSAYAVVFNDQHLVLALAVDGEYWLPGGGIELAEDPLAAISREAMEEAGAIIQNIEYIGKANQFIDDKPINKLGTFYKAKLASINNTLSKETHHVPIWITPAEFIEGNSPDFHKWAVKQA